METTGGEPDVVGDETKTGEYVFYDCSAQSPKGRRSVCYDHEALESRKEHKPKDSATGMAVAMGIDVLTEEQYRQLQQLGEFDTTTGARRTVPTTAYSLPFRQVFPGPAPAAGSLLHDDDGRQEVT